MGFSVTKLAQALVPPYEATPTGSLPLSSMDRNPRGLRYLYDSIHVFGHGDEPAKVIREALSKALVPYYPVAGRIVDSHQGEPEVACTGDGVWFVEASADCNLGDVNHLERPLMIPKQALLPCPSPQTKEKDAILLMQVTSLGIIIPQKHLLIQKPTQKVCMNSGDRIHLWWICTRHQIQSRIL